MRFTTPIFWSRNSSSIVPPFPLAFGEYRLSETGELLSWELHDDRNAVEYKLPPLSIMMLRTVSDFVPAKYQRSMQLKSATMETATSESKPVLRH